MNLKIHRSFSFLTVLALAIMLAQAVPVHAAAGDTTRLSLDSSDVEGNNVSETPSVSAGGRYVAFVSHATNLVGGDTNATIDVFVRDTLTNTTTRISLNSSGVEGNYLSASPSISADGRYVAFTSYADNLVSGDLNGIGDIFVRDTVTNTTTRASLNSSGVEGNNLSQNPSISADGRYVTFDSHATNLVGGDTNGKADIFVRDTATNTTTRLSLDSSGVEGNASSFHPSISADGRYVAFQSDASNLVSGDTNAMTDIFVRDTVANTTTRLSLDSSGVEGNADSFDPSISADGRYAAFASTSTNLVSGDANGGYDIFVRDTLTNTTTRVSLDSSGVEGNSFSYEPSISADGRYVAFQSFASNLVSGDTNAMNDVFVRDTVANTTTRLSLDSSGVEGNNVSFGPSISADGRYVAFHSDATNLVSGDSNGARDVFLHETSTDPTPPSVSFIACANSNPTSAASVDFTVTFSESVTGVDITDFLLITTNISGAYINGISGSGDTYTVTVNTGTGDGDLRLDLTDDDSILDLASNPLGGAGAGNGDFGGEVYIVDKTSPAVSSIVRTSANPTSNLVVHYAVTFTETVTGVDIYDFSLTYTTTSASITYVNCVPPGDICYVGVFTGTGNGTIQLNIPAGASINDPTGNPLGGLPYNSGETYTIQKMVNLRSVGAYDGWILESSEISNAGGTLNTTAATFNLGDNNLKKQYRGILSFSTGASLPDTAVITKVTLKVKRQGVIGGGNPVSIFQGFMVDIKKGFFGTAALQTSDFQAAAHKTYGPFMTALSGGWYSINLTPGKGYINKLSTLSGLTQIRLRFKLDDNTNAVANYLSLFSGNAPAASRPQLIIEYYVP